MSKLVYLFELDSARKYENPEKSGVLFTPGVRALFCEIIKNGNTVAITMNQLTDSELIKEALRDDVAYESLLRLFELGAIKLSLFGNFRTVSQYIQKALVPNEDKYLSGKFIFSNLPIKDDEAELRRDVKLALEFSDLARLQERVDNAVGEEALRMKEIYRFANMILQFSVCDTSNIRQREEVNKNFEAFLECILVILSSCDSFDEDFNSRLKKAVEIVRSRGLSITEGRGKRSNWLKMNAEENSDDELANEIINLAYNYKLEDSVNGVAKHYDDNDFENTFKNDLLNRVKVYLNSPKTDCGKMKTVSKAEWKRLVRFAEYKAERKFILEDTVAKNIYEKDWSKYRLNWIFFVFLKNIGSLLVGIMHIVLFFLVELLLSWLENRFSLSIDSVFISSVVTVGFLGVFGSIIGYALKYANKGDNIPDILESVYNIVIHFIDFLRTWGSANDSYRLY